MKKIVRSYVSIIVFTTLLFAVQHAEANNSWANYHWSRGSNPFVLSLGDNVSSQWEYYLARVSSDWSRSSRLDTRVVQGNANITHCRGNSAHIQVCNASYGKSGWLGLAQIGVNGDHILYGSVRVNDYYFSQSKYNTSAWKRLVMCQEVGHALGLGHQDENFSNAPLGSCMDYTSDPTPNQRPNMSDYYTLLDIYRHLDTSTAAQGTTIAADDTSIAADAGNDWGKIIKGTDRRNGGTTLAADASHIAVFEKDLGGGKKVNTVVVWAQE